MKTSHALALVTGIILALCAIPANAQPYERTWVAQNGGSDMNPCAINAPCATFAGALAQTSVGGEIDCLTPGDYGPVTINQSVSIICDGVSNGGILTSTAVDAIIVDAGSGAVVYLSGLDLNGFGATGAIGVWVKTGSTVYINHCTIRSFAGGVSVNSSTNDTRVIIKDSIIVNNAWVGVAVEGNGALNAALIDNSIVDANGNDAVVADGNYGATYVVLEHTLLTGSPTALDLVSGGHGEFIGPSNTVIGTVNGSPTSVAFQ
jgi:hypothetical protein